MHPRIRYQDPQSGNVGTDEYHPGGNQMKTTAYPVPAEEHDGEESGFEKESEQTFDGQRSSENIPDKPGIIRPVGTELEFQYQSRSYTDGEVDCKKLHPEFGGIQPLGLTGPDPHGFHNSQ